MAWFKRYWRSGHVDWMFVDADKNEDDDGLTPRWQSLRVHNRNFNGFCVPKYEDGTGEEWIFVEDGVVCDPRDKGERH